MRPIPVFLAFAAFLSLCNPQSTLGEELPMSHLVLTSPAFSHNGMIPAKYTCDGADVNPPLSIDGVPEKAKSLALIVDDPDAPRGTWVHWVVWNIPADTRVIPEGTVPPGALQGTNDFGSRKYGGPCPPSGTHRYFFKLYALDAPLALPPGATKAQVEKAMSGHLLGKAETVGLYRRK
ncbi:MAG: YbhB/YbcL family Raf kinase inhibitor-like protein [Deltaproteobacteria bacterium]